MENDTNKFTEVERRLEELLRSQSRLTAEAQLLRQELARLRGVQQPASPQKHTWATTAPIAPPDKAQKPSTKKNLEKFIGENLAGKIGIIIIVIGVAIGAKYSIERGLMSPPFRIALGYLAGFCLLALGVWLKKKYVGFSAVLVSGAMAIMYFISYAAHDFYELIPLPVTFVIMVLLTAVTVMAAIVYNRQVIAHIGMVGAYAVPLLLSSGSGNVLVLFTYMLIINGGILLLSLKKYWQPLHYSACGITWLIYIIWYATKYSSDQHFLLAFTFLILFFILFYLTFIVYKLNTKESFTLDNIVLLLSNSFIFYGLGYAMLNNHPVGHDYLGLFTLCNMAIHGAMGIFAYLHRAADKKLLYLLTGLAAVFATITVPIQLSGSWVTLLWLGEAVLLFGLGRVKQIPIYEKLAYPLMLTTLVSLLYGWSEVEALSKPFININFATSLLFVAGFTFINLFHFNPKYKSTLAKGSIVEVTINALLPFVLIGVAYFTFFLEINRCWSYEIAALNPIYGEVWLLCYSMLFATLLTVFNIFKLKNATFGTLCFLGNMLALFVFFTHGVPSLYELSTPTETFVPPVFNTAIRYISFAFVGVSLLAGYVIAKAQKPLRRIFDIALHASLLYILSNELHHWLKTAGVEQPERLWVSVLWGAYALMLVALGIWKKQKHLRLAAIVLFGATLIKLFCYDIAHMSTAAKTVAFISLGALLLIISFSYNKYKHLIFDEDKK